VPFYTVPRICPESPRISERDAAKEEMLDGKDNPNANDVNMIKLAIRGRASRVVADSIALVRVPTARGLYCARSERRMGSQGKARRHHERTLCPLMSPWLRMRGPSAWSPSSGFRFRHFTRVELVTRKADYSSREVERHPGWFDWCRRRKPQ
jgi:hypothetical protein